MSHPNWLCIGDFNQVLSSEDKFSFNWGKSRGMENFQELIYDLELCELAALGKKFTWMNNRMEEDFVMEKLYRAFASDEWINTYPSYALKNLPILHSDYGPIILDFDLQLPFKHRPFRFGHMWLTHPSWKEVVHKARISTHLVLELSNSKIKFLTLDLCFSNGTRTPLVRLKVIYSRNKFNSNSFRI